MALVPTLSPITVHQFCFPSGTISSSSQVSVGDAPKPLLASMLPRSLGFRRSSIVLRGEHLTVNPVLHPATSFNATWVPLPAVLSSRRALLGSKVRLQDKTSAHCFLLRVHGAGLVPQPTTNGNVLNRDPTPCRPLRPFPV